MEFKAFSFEQNSHTYAETKRAVAESVSDAAIYFESYSDSKVLFKDIADALDVADTLLIGIEPKAYLKFKPFLIKAFNFTPAYSDKIMDALEGGVNDEKLKKAHALIPNEAEELLTRDSLYSGFYVHEDNQYIVVFPLLENTAAAMLKSSGLPFFKPEEDKEEIFSDIKSGSSPKASSIIEKLLKNDLRIAIPSTPASKLLKSDIKACDDYSDFVFFTPYVNDNGVTDPKQYSAQLAKGAMELRSTDLGATISNIFREKKGDKIISYYAFISVATAEKVVVKKLFANPDENIDNLVTEATAELYRMIDKYIDEVVFKLRASADDNDKYEAAAIEAEVVSDVRPEASISKPGIIIAIIAIILAVVACIVLALSLSDYFVKSTDTQASDTLQDAGLPIDTTAAPQITVSQPVVPADTTPSDTVAEITDLPGDTSVFGVTTTLPGPDTSYNIIYTPNTNNYNPNNNYNTNNTEKDTTTTTKEDTTKPTKKPTTTEPKTTIENIGDSDW